MSGFAGAPHDRFDFLPVHRVDFLVCHAVEMVAWWECVVLVEHGVLVGGRGFAGGVRGELALVAVGVGDGGEAGVGFDADG